MGDAHAVLARRRAKVVGQDMREGSLLYEISAWLPVVESRSAWEKVKAEEKLGGGGGGGGAKSYSAGKNTGEQVRYVRLALIWGYFHWFSLGLFMTFLEGQFLLDFPLKAFL
jgi:hypothetical protein